jgi:hypothetical protein
MEETDQLHDPAVLLSGESSLSMGSCTGHSLGLDVLDTRKSNLDFWIFQLIA